MITLKDVKFSALDIYLMNPCVHIRRIWEVVPPKEKRSIEDIINLKPSMVNSWYPSVTHKLWLITIHMTSEQVIKTGYQLYPNSITLYREKPLSKIDSYMIMYVTFMYSDLNQEYNVSREALNKIWEAVKDLPFEGYDRCCFYDPTIIETRIKLYEKLLETYL